MPILDSSGLWDHEQHLNFQQAFRFLSPYAKGKLAEDPCKAALILLNKDPVHHPERVKDEENKGVDFRTNDGLYEVKNTRDGFNASSSWIQHYVVDYFRKTEEDLGRKLPHFLITPAPSDTTLIDMLVQDPTIRIVLLPHQVQSIEQQEEAKQTIYSILFPTLYYCEQCPEPIFPCASVESSFFDYPLYLSPSYYSSFEYCAWLYKQVFS